MLFIEGKKQRLLLQKLDLIEKINEKQFVLKKTKQQKKSQNKNPTKQPKKLHHPPVKKKSAPLGCGRELQIVRFWDQLCLPVSKQ